MKHRIIVAGICMGAWLCGSAGGQSTVITNLLVIGSQQQGTNALASGTNSTAQGNDSMAIGTYSHAEGDTTMASGTASHAEGVLTIAGGEQSHAEGLGTEALADNSHAGGSYARVRRQDSNSYIHATGSPGGLKETRFPNTAHFDHLVLLDSAINVSNAILSRAENDLRYATLAQGSMAATSLQPGTAITVSAVHVLGNINTVSGSAVAGGLGNQATGANTFVGAGSGNRAMGWEAFVGAGFNNIASSLGAFVGAGDGNTATGVVSSVVGGRDNSVAGNYSFIGGGFGNQIEANNAIIAGGYRNSALGAASVVGGGAYNMVSSNVSVLVGGDHNSALGKANCIGGGVRNTVTGDFGVVAGGFSNFVAGAYGVAGGYGAQALHDGSWVWADPQGGAVFPSITSNEFAIRAAGGLRLSGGRARIDYDPPIGTNQYSLWVRNFGSTPDDARGLLVTTPDYNGAEGIIFHAASMAGGSMASRFIVGADGNVGVGVNAPQSRFHVAGNARVSGNFLMLDGRSIISPNFIPGTWGSASDKWGPNAYLKHGYLRELHVAQKANFQDKVKIGTGSEYARLNVGAPTGLETPTYAARFESAEGANSDKARGVLINFPDNTNSNSILFHAMSGAGPYTNSRVVIKADGRVGIGTSYPEATLHVHGDARFDQAVWIQPAGDLGMGIYTNGTSE